MRHRFGPASRGSSSYHFKVMGWQDSDDGNGDRVACVLSGVWWLNARSASRAEGWQAMACYALGAGTGTALGLWLSAAI